MNGNENKRLRKVYIQWTEESIRSTMRRFGPKTSAKMVLKTMGTLQRAYTRAATRSRLHSNEAARQKQAARAMKRKYLEVCARQDAETAKLVISLTDQLKAAIEAAQAEQARADRYRAEAAEVRRLYLSGRTMVGKDLTSNRISV